VQKPEEDGGRQTNHHPAAISSPHGNHHPYQRLEKRLLACPGGHNWLCFGYTMWEAPKLTHCSRRLRNINWVRNQFFFSKLDFRHGCTCTELAAPAAAASRCRRQTFCSYLLREAISGKQTETKAIGMARETESLFTLQLTKSKESDCVLRWHRLPPALWTPRGAAISPPVSPGVPENYYVKKEQTKLCVPNWKKIANEQWEIILS